MKSGRPPKQHKPPRWAQRFVEWYCRPELAEDLLGDLNEYFERHVALIGPFRAKLVYVIDAFKFLRPYTARTLDFVNFLITSIMIGSYFRTSVRNVSRNKLFSSINIVGLAISMSVGLLLIAFVHDLLTYDKYNEKGNRIYRITSQAKFREGSPENFATTSLKIGESIQEKLTGVEESTIVTDMFTGDAKVGDNVLPLSGMYAGPSVFNVFTWPLLKGNAVTALKEPYSIVLTETSASRIFGTGDAFGKTVHVDSIGYVVTGIMKDVPFFSHIQFESLVSFSTLETRMLKEPSFITVDKIWERNYVYLLLPESSTPANVQAQLDAICADENKVNDDMQLRLTLLPLFDIVMGEDLLNSIRPVMPGIVLWIIGGLALVVILSACFNYTNLSIARSMRRFKEVGLRKVIGAGRSQVRQQFLAEAVMVSFIALVLSFGLFLVLRPQFISIAPNLLKMVKLEITTPMAFAFVVFALIVGIAAGFLPALFFAKVSAVHALRDSSSVKVFGRLSLRRTLVAVQYTLTLMFITCTMLGYTQYKKILAFDLGFTTANILNVELQHNEPDVLIAKLKALPEVTGISQSRIVTSVGNAWGAYIKYKDPRDSMLVFTNIIDENYIPLHQYHLIAGGNFVTRPATADATSEVIVNEKTLREFNIADRDPEKAVGMEILVNNRKMTIVGVIKDFHYATIDENIKPVAFTYLTPDAYLTRDKRDGVLNVAVSTNDPVATVSKIEQVWNMVDPVHTFQGEFYDDQIEDAYKELSAILKIVGFLSFIAISIASLGLLGMVVFTTETRFREMSIRKVLGASSGSLVVLLSRGFVAMLIVSALIALPTTYLFFEKVVLARFPFHDPIGVVELFAGFFAVLIIAFMMIGSQTLRAARSNPADVLKGE